MRHLKTQEGFTLVELLVALTILAIGMLGVLGMQVYAIRGNAFASNMTVAMNLAQQKLEYFRNLSYVAVKGPTGGPALAFGISYTSQGAVPAPDLPADDYIGFDAANDLVYVDVEGFGAIRSDHSGTVLQDGNADGVNDAPFNRFRRVTITKLIGEAAATNITMVIKVLVYWRGPSGGENKAVMMTLRSIGE